MPERRVRKRLEDTKILVLLGSSHAVPPTTNASGIAWLVYETVERLPQLDITVLSKWHPELETMSYDRERYQHIGSDALSSLTKLIARRVPDRLLKRKYGTTRPDRVALFAAFKRALVNYSPDVVISHVHQPLLHIATSACPAALHVFYCHESNLGEKPSRDWHALIANADAIVSINQYSLSQAETRFGPIPIPTTVISNGLDTNTFSVAKREKLRSSTREELGLSDSDVAILYAGRIRREKGLSEVFAAFGQLIAHNPRLRLLIAGDPMREGSPDHSYHEQLRSIASDFPSGSVWFLGWVPHQQLNKLYSAADVGVLASLEHEGNSLFTLECMACGTPTVVSRVGGMPEIVSHQETGLLVEVDALASNLEAALSYLIAHPDVRKSYGAEAARRVAKQFSIDRVALDLEMFLKRVVEGGSTGSAGH